jgi:hypothetical protein
MSENQEEHLVYLSALRMAYAKEYHAMFGGEGDWLSEEELNGLKDKPDITEKNRDDLLILQDPMVFDPTIQQNNQNKMLYANIDHFNTCAEATWRYFYKSDLDSLSKIRSQLSDLLKSSKSTTTMSKIESQTRTASQSIGSMVSKVSQLISKSGSVSSISKSDSQSFNEEFANKIKLEEVADLVKKQYEIYGRMAFGAHFLTDQFSTGHLLTPRSTLVKKCSFEIAGHSSGNAMHDEMCFNGAPVKINGQSCFAKGDSMWYRDHKCKPIIKPIMKYYFSVPYGKLLDDRYKDFDVKVEWDTASDLNEKLPCPIYLTSYYIGDKKTKTIDCGLTDEKDCQIYLRKKEMPEEKATKYSLKVGNKFCNYQIFDNTCVVSSDCCNNCCFKKRVATSFDKEKNAYIATGSISKTIKAIKTVILGGNDIGKVTRRRQPSSETENALNPK